MYDLPRIKDLNADEIARILGGQGQHVPLAFPVDLQVSIDELYGIDDAYAADKLTSEFETAA